MATAAEIATFRLLISESENVAPYDDESLSTRLDAASSREALAATIWTEKAASYAELVSVAESGSSRQLGDLHKHALAMAEHFRGLDQTAPGAPAVRGLRLSRLTRS